MRFIVVAAAILLSLSGCWGTRATDAFEQNRKLGRGVNIIGYDPIWRSLDQGRFRDKHFRLLKEAGFNAVRINLHPFRRMEGTKDPVLPESWFATLDWALNHCREQKLIAILDLHEFTAMGADAEGTHQKFLSFWRRISTRYRSAPDDVLFEILNEPNKEVTAARWNKYLIEALAIIREQNPNRTVIIGPAHWNAIGYLKELKLPEQDRNIIVTVHYYTPMEFTHQGAPWAEHKDKHDIEWTDSETELKLLETDFDKAAAWGREHNRPMFLGEFGAYDKAPMASRARYTAAVARAAEKRGWSWAYWQFDSDFILYDMKRDAWVKEILEALVPKERM